MKNFKRDCGAMLAILGVADGSISKEEARKLKINGKNFRLKVLRKF